MKATRVHVGIVLAELSKDFIDKGLMNEAKIRSSHSKSDGCFFVAIEKSFKLSVLLSLS